MVLRTPRDVGAFVRDRRKQLDLDQASLAARVGVSRKWLIDFEKGRPRAELGLVLRTFAALGVSLSPKDVEASVPDAADLDAIIARAREPRATTKRMGPKPTRRSKR